MTARLRRRIKVFPAGGDVCFFVGEVMLLFFLCGSGRLAGGSPGRFVSLSACGGGNFLSSLVVTASSGLLRWSATADGSGRRFLGRRRRILGSSSGQASSASVPDLFTSMPDLGRRRWQCRRLSGVEVSLPFAARHGSSMARQRRRFRGRWICLSQVCTPPPWGMGRIGCRGGGR